MNSELTLEILKPVVTVCKVESLILSVSRSPSIKTSVSFIAIKKEELVVIPMPKPFAKV